MIKNSEPYGLYIHVPFCIRKCNYCDFYSLPYSDDLASEYGKALISELKLISEKYQKPKIDTVYIGGGTPSLLRAGILGEISEAVYKYFDFDNKEFTIEVNPATDVSFDFYKSIGINRVSIGVQSLDDKVLKIIGRLHDSKTALQTLERASSTLENVSADLMLGLPFSDIPTVKRDICTLSPFVKHISAYILKLSETVPMYKQFARGEIIIGDDDFEADMYDATLETLESCGLFRYEISNFARKGYESRHNLKYWHRIGYFAAGPAAHSFIDGIRYANAPDLKAYLRGENILTGNGETTPLTNQDALFETIMLSLRLPQGIDIPQIKTDFGIDFLKKYSAPIKNLSGILTFDGTHLFIHKDKFLLESAIAREFLQ